MTKRENDFLSLGEVIQKMLEQNKLQEGMNRLAVQIAWKDVMGKAVTGYTSEILWKNKTLTVRLKSCVLREELNYGKDKIIKMMNEALGKELVEKLVLL